MISKLKRRFMVICWKNTLGDNGEYAAIFLEGSDDRVAALIRKFPQSGSADQTEQPGATASEPGAD